MRRLLHAGLAVLAAVCLVHPALADLSPLEVTEEDASPSTFPYQVKFSNGALTDNGDGTTSISVISAASPTFTGDVTISDTSPSLVFTDTTASEDDFELVVDGDGAYFADTTDSVIAWLLNSQNSLKLGEVGHEIASLSVHTTATGNMAVQVPLNSIGVQELDAIDEPADGESYTYDSATARGEWAGGGSGAPTDATYITQTANGTLSAEQALESLSTGIMRVATVTGAITSLTDSSGIAANISDEQGSGALVFATSPTLTTPTIGAATATSIAIGANTLTTSEWANLDGIDQAVATTSSPSFVDLTLAGSGSDLTIQATGADAVGFHSEASVPLRIINETDAQDYIRFLASNFIETVTKLVVNGGAVLNGKIDASAANVVSMNQCISKTLAFPDTLQAEQDNWLLFEVETPAYPFGITITKVKIVTDASTSLTYNLEEWTSPSDGSPSTITGLPLVASDERTFTSFADNSVAAGSMVMVDLDTTDISWAAITVWFHAKTA